MRLKRLMLLLALLMLGLLVMGTAAASNEDEEEEDQEMEQEEEEAELEDEFEADLSGDKEVPPPRLWGKLSFFLPGRDPAGLSGERSVGWCAAAPAAVRPGGVIREQHACMGAVR